MMICEKNYNKNCKTAGFIRFSPTRNDDELQTDADEMNRPICNGWKSSLVITKLYKTTCVKYSVLFLVTVGCKMITVNYVAIKVAFGL